MIHTMTKAQLIAKIERDDAALARAAGVLRDNADLQAKVADLRSKLAAEIAKPPRVEVRDVPRRVVERVEVPGPERIVTREVPTPCPEQAKEIARLQRKIGALEKKLEAEKAKPPKVKTVTVEKPVEVVRRVVEKVDVPGPVRTVTRDVPTPCPEQAKQIRALQSQVAKFANYDMTMFERWCEMVKVAEDNA